MRRYTKTYMSSRRRDSKRATVLRIRHLVFKMRMRVYTRTGKRYQIAKKRWHCLKV